MSPFGTHQVRSYFAEDHSFPWGTVMLGAQQTIQASCPAESSFGLIHREVAWEGKHAHTGHI